MGTKADHVCLPVQPDRSGARDSRRQFVLLRPLFLKWARESSWILGLLWRNEFSNEQSWEFEVHVLTMPFNERKLPSRLLTLLSLWVAVFSTYCLQSVGWPLLWPKYCLHVCTQVHVYTRMCTHPPLTAQPRPPCGSQSLESRSRNSLGSTPGQGGLPKCVPHPQSPCLYFLPWPSGRMDVHIIHLW